jgi:putative DNA primase/helicase
MPIVKKAISASAHDKTDLDEERARLILAGLEKQYLKADDKYHFRNDARDVAFEAHEGKLVTQREDPAVIASMIELAEARGWSSLKLNGSQDFRKEAWLQASLRGMDVSGYQPDKVDLARLDELKAERAGVPASTRGNVIAERALSSSSTKEKGGLQTAEPKISLSKAQEQVVAVLAKIMAERGDSPEAIAMASEMAAERLRSDRVHVGKLVETGTAPYNNVPGEKQSPFVVLADDKGNKDTIWGVDLPRALEASGAKVGDKVALAFGGRQDVTVQTAITDATGKVTGHEAKVVNRNAWEIVQFDKLRDEGKAKVLEAAQRKDQPSTIQVFDKPVAPTKAAPTVSREREPQR